MDILWIIWCHWKFIPYIPCIRTGTIFTCRCRIQFDDPLENSAWKPFVMWPTLKKIAQTAKIKNKKGHAVGEIGVGWIWEVLREGWIWPEYTLRDLKELIPYLFKYTSMNLGFQRLGESLIFALVKGMVSVVFIVILGGAEYWLVLVCLITGLFNMNM